MSALVVVEADQDLHLLIETVFSLDSRFTVAGVSTTAEDALEMARTTNPAMIVLDVQMPGIDGPTFARELRTRLRRVPLVILTGVADPKREADRCNAEAFLRKPFDADELVRLVRRFST